MFKKILNFLLLSSITSAIFMLFFACSVGLGESVDTEVPKIEITYPPASSPVRDWFCLAGTASDDKGVASVSVSAENISTNEITDLGTFTPEKDGTWAVKINEKDSSENYKLKDGTYTFCVIAKDTSSQKSAPAYRTIEVDNTPPVFVIKNPGTIKAGKPSAFGSILKIVGAAADDHDIYELSLAVYDNPAMEGEPKAVISEKNVDKTDGINVTLARYNLAVDSGAAMDELHNNYLKIYDAAGGGNQNFFASVTLKDSAGVWQDYTKNQPSSVGNSTNGGLYLNDSVYETLMGKKSKYGLSAADFMRLLNGTYKNTAVSASSEERTAAATQASLDDEAKKEILKILGERKTETSKTPLAFSLNKNANPTYTVMGFSFDSSAESIANLGGHKAAKQNSLTFKAQAGLDGAYVKPTTLKIYLFGPYENGFCTAEKLEEIYSDPDLFYERSIKTAKESAKAANGGTEPSEELVAGFAKAQILKDYSSSGASTAETFSESIELPSFITKGKYYLLAATGEDEDGVKLVSSYYYGFVGESAGTPPAVSITGFADGVMKNSVSKIKVSGTLKSEETELAGVAYSVVVFDEIASKTVGTITGEVSSDNFTLDSKRLSASWEVQDILKGTLSYEKGYAAFEPENGERFKYTVTVTGKDTTGLVSKDTRSFTVDRKVPEIKINDITPVAKKETAADGTVSKYIVNGKIKFSTVVSDTNLKNVKVTVTDGTKSETLFEGNSSTIEKEIDTTKYKDENFLTFKVEAEDSAENTAVSSKTDVWVSQKTDMPEIKFTNGKSAEELGGSGWANVTNGQNVFGIENNNSANFTITDDDGLSLVRVTVFDENQKQIGSEGAVSVADAQLQAQPDSENAKDSAKNPVEYKVSGGSTTYALAYKLPQKAGKYIIKLEVQDIGYKSVSDTNNITTAENYILVSEGNISISLTNAENKEKNKFVISNNESLVKASVDTIISGTVSLSSLDKLTNIERYAMQKKSVGDEKTWEIVGEAVAKYKLTETETNLVKITAEEETGKIVWKDTIAASDIKDGVQHYYYKVTDMSGTSAAVELVLKGDGEKPSISRDETEKYEWKTSSSVKLSVVVADSKGSADGSMASGINGVTYSYGVGVGKISGELARGKACDNKGNENALNKDFYKYSTTIQLNETSGTQVNFSVEDNVGNKNSADIGYKVDTMAPEKNKLAIDSGLYKKNTGSVEVSYAFADATSGLSKIEFCTNNKFTNSKTYKVIPSETEAADFEVGSKEYGTAEVPKTISILLSDLNDGEYKIYARVTDVAGNVSEIFETDNLFTVDNTSPVVKITSHTKESTEKNPLNKVVTFSGIVNELNLPENATPILYAYKEKWQLITSIETKLEAQSWSLTFDTNPKDPDSVLYDLKPGTLIPFQVVFTDKADNSNFMETETTSGCFNINQISDLPIITFSDITDFEGSVISRSSFKGFVSDDDGDVKGLWYIDSSNYDSEKLPSEGNANGWKKIDVATTTGDWKITLEKEGGNSFEFCAIDNAGTVFDTRNNSAYNRPILKVGTKTQLEPQSIKLTYDKTPPAVKVSYAHDAGFENASSLFGPNESVYIKAVVTEAVGLNSEYPIVLEIAGISRTANATVTSIKNEEGNVIGYTYTFNGISIKDIAANGSAQIAVTAKDKAGLEGKGIEQITIDTEAPTIKIVSPTASISDAITGAVTIKGIAQDNASSISRVQYLIPTVAQAKLEKTVENFKAANWKDIGNSGSWEIQFASGAAESPDSILYYVDAKENNTNVYAVEQYGSDEENLWKVPVYFQVTDSCGNSAVRATYKDSNSNEEKPLFVIVDPDGGKPKAWINSPEEGSTTSGLVTIYGGASDDISVDKVQIQIDANGDGNFDSADYTLLNSASGWAGTEANQNLGGSASDWWISANGTNSWKRAIDTDKIAKSSDGKKYLRFRVRAYDGDTPIPQTRGWSKVVSVNIDSEVPVIKDLKVVQFGAGVTADSSTVTGLTPITEREYISGMYISNIMEKSNGTFYLVGTVTDNQQVKTITFKKQTTSSSVPNIDLGISKEVSNSKASYNLCVPLKTEQSGQIYYIIKAFDDNTGETTQSIVINIDSTKPGMFITGGSESLNIGENLRLKSLGKNLGTDSSNSTVVNSNSYFTFGDIVSEAGSGLAYIVATFERNGSVGGKRIYNPMQNNTNLALASSESELSSDGKPYICEEGFAIQKFDVTRDDEYSIKATEFTQSAILPFIQKGGLVRIAGTYCLITDFDKNNGTITLSKSVSTDFTKAELIFAQVIDHQIVETPKTDGGVENDDGDGMIETITQTGSSYNWTASIDSLNIPDGPITIHVVAIDNAGNTNYGYVKTKVENNRPRIAKVLLGTDLNGNGTYDWNASSAPVTKGDSEKDTKDGKSFGEFSYFTALDSNSGKAQSVVKLNSDSFKVLGKLCIIPEFVGGNIGLGYMLEYPSDLSNAEYKTGTVTEMISKSAINDKVNSDGGIYKIDSEISDFGGIELAPSSGNISITFWDKTEETTQGTDSQWALLKIPVNLMTDEKEKPKSKIRPFYWNSSTENSVFIDGAIRGHIELEKDLTSSITSSLGDDDPKVSGKIKIEGTVYDNVRIYSISASVFGGTSSVVASYNAGIWAQNSSLPECVESFTAEDMDMSQNGHTVKYTMIVDTEKLSDSAGLEKTIIITAKDWQGNTSEASSAQTVTGTITVNDVSYSTGTTNYYKMDVVPYVTEIVTNLSSYSLDNPSVYARSSVGSYPVYEGEEIEIKGYNLGQGNASVTINGKTVKLDSGNKMKVDSSVSSGTVSVSVEGISAVNNLNKNDAIGSYSGSASDNDYANCYNRQPNGVNNNLLTDDLSLDVWNFKTAASPIGSSANYVHMKVGPYLSNDSANSGRIGFSFKNAIGYFNMPGQKSGNSYTVTNNSVDLYVNSSLDYIAIHHWGNSDKNKTEVPISLGSAVSYKGGSYYHISFSSSDLDITSSGDTTLQFLLTKKVGDYTDKTGDCMITRVGCYVIDSVPSGTISPTTEYRTSTVGNKVFSQTRFGTNFGGFNHNTFAFDKNGYTYGAAQCPDTSGQAGMSANFQFFSRGVSDESSDYHGLNFNYFNVTNGRRIENTSYYKNSIVYTDENRVQNPEMATYVSDSTSYVYLAYYDHGLDMIKFRVGSVGSSANSIGLGLQDLDKFTSNKHSENDANKICDSNKNLKDSLDSTYEGDQGNAYKYVTKIANRGASPYVAVGALPTDGTAVVVWYDKNEQALKMKSATFSSVKSDSVSWTDHSTISTIGGKYVSMATDEAGGIHLAYLSNSGANLYYTYMSSVSATPVTMLVDAYQDVGDRCMITVGRESTSKPWIPYISYKSNYASHTKIAYPVFASDASSSTLPSAGIVDGTEKYAGAWNVSLVPDTNLSIDDTVSVGVNKDWASGSGVMYVFPTGETQKASDTGVYALCDATIVYGNGTKNPVMGYAIEDGTIQMAQKK